MCHEAPRRTTPATFGPRGVETLKSKMSVIFAAVASLIGAYVNIGIVLAATRFVLGCLAFMWYLFASFVLDKLFKRWRLKDIRGDVALVTGGGSGIGRLLCLELARRGARIVVWDLNLNGAQKTAQLVQDEGGSAFAYECDVSSAAAVTSMAEKVRNEVGRVSILINNAGVVSSGRIGELSEQSVLKNMHVNTFAHFWTIRAFLADMQQANHGHLVTISSLAGLVGVPRLSEYCTSKFAACGIAESLAIELHADGFTGVQSTIVCPYFTSTGMFNGVGGRVAMLEPESVAKDTVEAMLLNEAYVILPRYMGWIVPVKFILPMECSVLLGKAFGMTDCMATFAPQNRRH